MAESTDQIKALNTKLDAELARLNSTQNKTIGVGCLILVVIFVYFSSINARLSGALTTQNLSNILAMYAAQTIPQYSDNLQKQVERTLPGFADSTKKEILVQLKDYRVQGNERLKQYIRKIFDDVDAALEAEIKRHGSVYQMAITQQLRAMQDEQIARNQMAGIEAVIQQAIFKEVDHILDLSLVKLQKIETQISNAIHNNDPNEKEKQIRTFIVYWFNFFEQSFELSAKTGLKT